MRDGIPLALRGPSETREEVDARLRDDLADAMVLFGLGRITPSEYARRARRVKDARLALDARRPPA